MGIRISETSSLLQVPYGPSTNDGVPQETGFIDLKANPAWVGVVPSALGWPEAQALLGALNAPTSPFMTLASAQGFSMPDEVPEGVVLSSFVTVCFADWPANSRSALTRLALGLRDGMDGALQAVATYLGRSVDLRVVLELQPTRFGPEGIEGWSMTVWMAAPGRDVEASRATWRLGLEALAGTIASLS